jgi:hypothetical protein
MAEDLSARRTSDVLAALGGDHQVEISSVDRLKGLGPDPSVEIELHPIVRQLQDFQTHAGPKLPQQCPIPRRAEVFLCGQRR